MAIRGVTLVRGTIVVLDLDGTLVYVEDVQPTGARVVTLPEQFPERKDSAVFTPGRVGAKVISPYSGFTREVAVTALSQRNKDFIGTYEVLRSQLGPNHIARTPEEEAAMSVVKAEPPKVHKGGRGAKKTDEERKQKRQARKAAKVPCSKCGMLPVHANHHGGTCEYEGLVRVAATQASKANEPKVGLTYRMVNADIVGLQQTNDKFAQGNRYYRVFLALRNLPESTGTLAQIIAAVAQDAGKPMTNPEKVARRALNALGNTGNVTSA